MVGANDAVRTVLREIPGVELVEMKTFGRDALCCGGGGGQMWLDRPVEQRIENVRANDVLATKAGECLTACPYCTRMLSDGLDGVGGDVRVRSWVDWETGNLW
jgi:Fe-S oxidoreductase